jgi:hypothetical protein
MKQLFERLLPRPKLEKAHTVARYSEPLDLILELQQLFAVHHVPLTLQDGWLTTDGNYPACRAIVSDRRYYESAVNVQLDVEVALNKNKSIVESFSDTGLSLENAIEVSLFHFAKSSLLRKVHCMCY